MEKHHCNVCESVDIEPYITKGEWEIARCNRCGLIFLKNIPAEEEIRGIYGDSFFEDGQKLPKKALKLDKNPAYRNSIKRLGRIRKVGPAKGRLLDVGCGIGIFLKAASSFYDCTGVDISDYAIEFAVRNLGVDARRGTIFDFEFQPGSIDIITMWDVIEHVRDPNQYIGKIAKIVKPGGLLALTTGNVDSLMFKIQKKNWHLLTPPQHLFFFNPATLTQLLSKHGFGVIRLEHRGQYTNVGYIMGKLKRIQENHKVVGWIDKLTNAVKLDKLDIYLNLFDVITVYARPSSKNYRSSVPRSK